MIDDRERTPLDWLVLAIAVGMSVFHIQVAYTGGYEPLYQRALSYLFGMALIFIVYRRPAGGGWRAAAAAAVFLLAVASVAYPILNIDYFLDRLYYVDPLTPLDLILGTAVLALTFEAARRTINLALPMISLFFIVYSYFGPYFPGIWRTRARPTCTSWIINT